MQMTWQTVLSWACLLGGILFYLAGVSGMLFGDATPAGDIGLVSTSLVLVLFGAVGIFLTRRQPVA